MKILLIDADGKGPNLALMKLSAYHKARGDKVSLNFALGDYDKIYASCVFPKNKKNLAKYPHRNIEMGGSGIDLKKKLPNAIEFMAPDYSLYNIDYGLGFITRGCIRKCPFCIVPEKEGKLKFAQDPREFKNPLSNKMIFLDGNFLALKNHKLFLSQFIQRKWRIDFNQGLDIRLINRENAQLLRKINWLSYIRFAWDLMETETKVRKGIDILKEAGFKQIMFYVLAGFNTTLEEDKYRFEILKGLGVTPFVMLYEKEKQPRIKKEFQRWGTMPYFWRKVPFEQFLVHRRVKRKKLYEVGKDNGDKKN